MANDASNTQIKIFTAQRAPIIVTDNEVSMIVEKYSVIDVRVWGML